MIGFLVLVLVGCRTPLGKTADCSAGLSLVNAALWQQSAAEYRASATQTYTVARQALDAALATASDRPSAIILDLDETSIDNSRFEARMVHAGKTYDAGAWKQWVGESAAGATPGAAEFLAHAHSRGVTPFYITNRKADEEPATRRNLEKLGFPLDPNEDNLLTRGERQEWSTTDKSARRHYVASRYRVLLTLGDDLNDFINAQGKDEQQRLDLMRQNAGRWGTSWFILPNPMYGSWETTLAGSGSACEQLKKKVEALTP
ncbi:MAG: 5'-nucleotidase, lipoprotein e(P4) family [Thermoanaerobaculia bacterium]